MRPNRAVPPVEVAAAAPARPPVATLPSAGAPTGFWPALARELAGRDRTVLTAVIATMC